MTAGYGPFHRVVHRVRDAALISLIVRTRGDLDLLRHTIDGIFNQTDYRPLEVVTVDSGDSDEREVNYLRELARAGRVRVLRREGSFNYSAAGNLGISSAKGAVVGLIDGGIRPVSAGWLREMVSHALRDEIGAVGAKLYNEDDRIEHAGVLLGVKGVAGYAHKLLSRESSGYMSQAQLIRNYSAVTGACLVMRRKVFDEVGGLDELNLPFAYGDIDLCLRVREKGYRILWTPYAELYYLRASAPGPDATPENSPPAAGEADYMKDRWGALLRHDPYYNPNLSLDAEDFSLAFPPRSPTPWKCNPGAAG